MGLEASAGLIAAWGGQVWPVPMVIGGATEAGRERYRRMGDTVGEDAARRMGEKFAGINLAIPQLKMAIWSHNKYAIRH